MVFGQFDEVSCSDVFATDRDWSGCGQLGEAFFVDCAVLLNDFVVIPEFFEERQSEDHTDGSPVSDQEAHL